MVSTRVGYAGGRKKDPTYHAIGDHAETIQIDFDPSVISYGELLDLFWRSHDPTRKPWSRQYMSAVFVHDEEQRRQVEDTARAVAENRGRPVETEILPFNDFTLAEDYHQKYQLRRLSKVERELEAIYPDLDDFVRSTAATRINALVGGSGTTEELEQIAAELGLSAEALDELRRAVR